MRDPEGLYELNPDVGDVPDGLPLVAGLTGFADAGAGVSQLDDYLTRSGYRITPHVVWAGDLPFVPVPHEAEVASVHVLPVADLDVEPRFISIPESDRPVIQVPVAGSLVHAPTGAILHQFREVVIHGRSTRVAAYEQPVFAWR